MSEWKWCGDCGHRYDKHLLCTDPKGMEYRGQCVGGECECMQMYWTDTP